MTYIEQLLKNKSIQYMRGFLKGVYAFAYMKDGVYYIGTTDKTFEEVKTEVEDLIIKAGGSL